MVLAQMEIVRNRCPIEGGFCDWWLLEEGGKAARLRCCKAAAEASISLSDKSLFHP
jgi:hypothetical protein